MKKKHEWEPTKFVFDKKRRLVVNPEYVSNKSLLTANRAARLYEKFLKEHSEGVFLDLGCGTVPLYAAYRDLVEETICIDWENSPHENMHLDYAADLNNGIPLADEAVNTILLSDVFEHINDPERLMSEISRVLKIDGKLILGSPFLYWLHEEPYDFHRYTRHQYKYLCEKNNLEIVQMEETGGPLAVIFDIIGKNLPAKFFSITFQKIGIWFLDTKLGKKIDNRKKKKFSLGYSLVAKKYEK
jgi:SAM-dependent methyltransferase